MHQSIKWLWSHNIRINQSNCCDCIWFIPSNNNKGLKSKYFAHTVTKRSFAIIALKKSGASNLNLVANIKMDFCLSSPEHESIRNWPVTGLFGSWNLIIRHSKFSNHVFDWQQRVIKCIFLYEIILYQSILGFCIEWERESPSDVNSICTGNTRSQNVLSELLPLWFWYTLHSTLSSFWQDNGTP